jgi:hypothetical protein
MAFVAGIAILPSGLTTPLAPSFVSRGPVGCSARRTGPAVLMAMSPQEDVKLPQIPQGFTLFSEQLNGRAAMFGFLLAIATEIINPNHPGIAAQVASVFEVIKNI